MHLGLIGGIGPAATVAYYQRLTQRCADEGVSPELTIAHVDIRTVSANIMADARQEQAAAFAETVARLRGAGAEVATLTAISAHFCFDELRDISLLPLIDAISPVEAALKARGVRRVGVLGQVRVMETRLLGRLRGVETVAPEGEALANLGRAYSRLAHTGACDEADRAAFFDAGWRLIHEEGAQAILLAGTDLGLAFDGHDPGFPVLDALDIHVEALLDAVRKPS